MISIRKCNNQKNRTQRQYRDIKSSVSKVIFQFCSEKDVFVSYSIISNKNLFFHRLLHSIQCSRSDILLFFSGCSKFGSCIFTLAYSEKPCRNQPGILWILICRYISISLVRQLQHHNQISSCPQQADWKGKRYFT